MWLVVTIINSPAIDPPLTVENTKDGKNDKLFTD